MTKVIRSYIQAEDSEGELRESGCTAHIKLNTDKKRKQN